MDEVEVSARFAAQMLGVQISDEPPPPDSPLGKLMALREERPLTADDFAAAMREGLRLAEQAGLATVDQDDVLD